MPSSAVRPTRPTRVMPLGDSITGSPGCWRKLLWQRLQEAGISDFTFVGTLPDPGCAGPDHEAHGEGEYGGDNEGHGGFLAIEIAREKLLLDWFVQARPDIVIMHLGTNDIWQNRATDDIVTAYGELVRQMRERNPLVIVLVAKILPMTPDDNPGASLQVARLNAAIPAWAAAESTILSPITVVDQWSGFNTATDTWDGVHPTPSGDTKIAARWYPALAAQLAAFQPLE